MTWTTLTFAFGSVLTSAKMTNLYNNFQALADKDASAPVLANDYVTAAMIAANQVDTSELVAASVTQSILSTSTASASRSSTGAATMSSGTYGFYPQVKRGAGSLTTGEIMLFRGAFADISTSYQTLVGFTISGSITLFAQSRYVLSSPPFDLGDGDVPLFVYALVDNATGAIEAATTARVPPWAYNGPTNISADRYSKDGRAYKRVWVPEGVAAADGIAAAMVLPLAEKRRRAGSWEEVEVSQAIKNADMQLIPHPFHGDLTGKTVVLLDPVDDRLADLADMQDAGEIVDELLFAKDLRIKSEIANRAAPDGVTVCGFDWR